MRKPEAFRPDCQVVRDGKWGSVYKPVRLLALPCGGMVCLMHGYDDTWLVFSLDTNGVVARSGPYAMKSVSEVAWHELCTELTKNKTNELVKVLSEPGATLTGKQRADAALELCRLEIADDDKCEGIQALAEQFCRRHTPAEVETHIKQELDAYNAMRAADGDGEES